MAGRGAVTKSVYIETIAMATAALTFAAEGGSGKFEYFTDNTGARDNRARGRPRDRVTNDVLRQLPPPSLPCRGRSLRAVASEGGPVGQGS